MSSGFFIAFQSPRCGYSWCLPFSAHSSSWVLRCSTAQVVPTTRPKSKRIMSKRITSKLITSAANREAAPDKTAR